MYVLVALYGIHIVVDANHIATLAVAVVECKYGARNLHLVEVEDVYAVACADVSLMLVDTAEGASVASVRANVLYLLQYAHRVGIAYGDASTAHLCSSVFRLLSHDVVAVAPRCAVAARSAYLLSHVIAP